MKMLIIKKEILEDRLELLEKSNIGRGGINELIRLQSQTNEVEIVDIQEERVRWADNIDFGGTFADWLEWNKLILTKQIPKL